MKKKKTRQRFGTLSNLVKLIPLLLAGADIACFGTLSNNSPLIKERF